MAERKLDIVHRTACMRFLILIASLFEAILAAHSKFIESTFNPSSIQLHYSIPLTKNDMTMISEIVLKHVIQEAWENGITPTIQIQEKQVPVDSIASLLPVRPHIEQCAVLHHQSTLTAATVKQRIDTLDW